MKVLLINHFPLEGSGSGTYTKNIALHLRKRGHEVCVIFPENRPVLMLPGIRMFPVMFSTGKASWSSLPFNFPCFTTHPQSRTTFADLSSCCFANKLRKIFIQSAKKKRRLKGF